MSRETITGTLTRPANVTAYAAGDAISDATANAHFTFANFFLGGPLVARIDTAILVSSAAQSTKLAADLVLFHTDIATTADNSPWAVTDAELLTTLGRVSWATADWVNGTGTAGAGGNAFAQTRPAHVMESRTTTGSATVYGQLVARNAYTPVSGEILTVYLVVDRLSAK